MTEIKTLIATEEPLEKQVSQVNLSQAYLSGQVCSCLVRMKKVVVRVFFLWIKSACLSAVCRAKQLDQQGGRTMGEPISASKHGFGQLMFHSHVGFHLELQQTQCVMWDNTRRSVCVCDLSFPGDFPPVKGCLASLLGSLKRTKG